MMEIGHMLMGRTPLAHPVDRRSTAADMLLDLMALLGFDTYGIPEASDCPAASGMDGRARRFTVADPADGRTLLTVRPYYWGDDPDAGLLANLEAPGIGLEVSWYKYMFRDATSSLPVDDELVSRLTDMLRPVLDAMAARRDARWDPIPLLRARGETGPRDPYGERLHPGRRFGFDVILNGDGNGGEWIAAGPVVPGAAAPLLARLRSPEGRSRLRTLADEEEREWRRLTGGAGMRTGGDDPTIAGR